MDIDLEQKLYRLQTRISRACDRNSGITLRTDDLELLVLAGAYRKLAMAAVDEMEKNVRERLGIEEPSKCAEPADAKEGK